MRQKIILSQPHPSPSCVWTITHRVEQQICHIGVGGAEYFAVITLTVEPAEESADIMFVAAVPPDPHVQDGAFADPRAMAVYLAAVCRGVTRALQELADAHCSIQSVLITVTEVRIHPVDSRENAYQYAGRKAIHTVLDPANLRAMA